MTCARVREILPLYEMDILDRRDMDAVAHHLDKCVDCREWRTDEPEFADVGMMLSSSQSGTGVENRGLDVGRPVRWLARTLTGGLHRAT